MVDLAVDSPLMGWPPNDTAAPVPLLASSQPTISDGGKTITFKIKPNIHYSPPLGGGPGWSKPVVSAGRQVRDRARADARRSERVPDAVLRRPGRPFAGRGGGQEGPEEGAEHQRHRDARTPRRSSSNLTKPSSIGLIGTLSLPLSSPVPQGYAAKYDSQTPSSTYGQHQIDVGPYYISSYQPGKQITLLRNPNYTAGSDFRPAYVDKVVVQEGFTDTNSAVSKILTGSGMVNFDFSATGESLKVAATQYPKQLSLLPGAATVTSRSTRPSRRSTTSTFARR